MGMESVLAVGSVIYKLVLWVWNQSYEYEISALGINLWAWNQSYGYVINALGVSLVGRESVSWKWNQCFSNQSYGYSITFMDRYGISLLRMESILW